MNLGVPILTRVFLGLRGIAVLAGGLLALSGVVKLALGGGSGLVRPVWLMRAGALVVPSSLLAILTRAWVLTLRRISVLGRSLPRGGGSALPWVTVPARARVLSGSRRPVLGLRILSLALVGPWRGVRSLTVVLTLDRVLAWGGVLPLSRLPVLGLPVLGLPVLGLPVLGLPVLALAVLALAVLGLPVLRLAVLSLAVLGLVISALARVLAWLGIAALPILFGLTVLLTVVRSMIGPVALAVIAAGRAVAPPAGPGTLA